MIEGVDEVKRNIRTIEERKIVATIALCRYYGGYALEQFQRRQAGNKYWDNQTNTAYNEVFSGTYEYPTWVGFFLAHAVVYGVYLELANDRKHEALQPIMVEILPLFEKDLREIWE